MHWPRVKTETLPWAPAPSTYPRRAAKKMPREYEAAVVPRIASQQLTLTADVLALLDEFAEASGRRS